MDALDETGETRRNPVVEMLVRKPRRLPDWLGHEPVFGTS
jgi:hypothetical protein